MKLSSSLVAGFKKQIALETGNALAYLQAYGWHRALGFEGISKRYKNECFEELAHAQNWTKYLARREEPVGEIIPAKLKSVLPADVKGIASLIADLEDYTETSMKALAASAVKEGDEGAVDYIDEQIREQEKASQDARDFANRIKDLDPGALVIIDRKIENGKW